MKFFTFFKRNIETLYVTIINYLYNNSTQVTMKNLMIIKKKKKKKQCVVIKEIGELRATINGLFL